MPQFQRKKPLKWNDKKIEATLKRVVERLGHWPSQAELLALGRGDLLGAVKRRGGREHWARRLGVEPTQPFGRIWTDSRLEEELRQFITGRSTWPTKREFSDAGRVDLYGAINRRGGHRVWATRLGLPAPQLGRPRQLD